MKRVLGRLLLLGGLCMGFVACSDEELPIPTPHPTNATEYTTLGVELIAAEGENTLTGPDGCKVYFRIYANENRIKGFDLEAPFYGWIESELLPHPKLKLEKVSSLPDGIRFTISSSCAEELYWICVEREREITWNQVMREGERAAANAKLELEQTGLVAGESYAIYAALRGHFENCLSEPLLFIVPEAEEPSETPDETPDETTRRFEEDENQEVTPPVEEEPTEEEPTEEEVDRSLRFLPQYFVYGSSYAYFSTAKNISVWAGDGAVDYYYDYRIGLFGLLAPVELFDYPDEHYYRFRLRLFQPSNGGYFETPWFRLDLGENRSSICRFVEEKEEK